VQVCVVSLAPTKSSFTNVLQGLTVEIAAVVCCRDLLKKLLIAAKGGHNYY
jgi:hypothetical protein